MSASLQAGFNAAVQEHNLRVAGYPRFEGKEGGEGQEVRFSALFEVYPEVKIGDISSGNIKRPQVSLTDADVEKTLEVLRKQRREFNPVERPAQNDDRVKFDFMRHTWTARLSKAAKARAILRFWGKGISQGF